MFTDYKERLFQILILLGHIIFYVKVQRVQLCNAPKARINRLWTQQKHMKVVILKAHFKCQREGRMWEDKFMTIL